MSRANMILIRIDELGDECEVENFTLSLDLDEDELDIWKCRKIEKAWDRYPEARGFYFEDRRHWGSLINRMMYDPTYEPDFY